MNDANSSILPMQPIGSYRDLSQAFAEKHLGSRLKRYLFLKSMAAWRKIFRIDTAEQKITAAHAQGKDAFWHDRWIFKSLYYPEIAATFLLADDGEKDPSKKAAQMIFGALTFRKELLQGNLPMEFEASKPLDMQRYHFFFSRAKLSQCGKNGMIHKIVDFPAVEYVVVGVGGHFFRLTVMQDNKILSYSTLHSQIDAVIQEMAQSPHQETAPFGLLTALNTRKSAPLLEELRANNQEVCDIIDRALFFVALDLDASPKSLDQVLRSIHADNFHNRDHRRSLQIVITGNGRAGIVVDPHSGIGGSLSARFCSELYKTGKLLANADATKSDPAPKSGLCERLTLNGGCLRRPEKRKILSQLETKIRQQIYPKAVPTTFRLEGIGKDDFAALKLSADGAFHCALHLAYHRTFGTKPVIGNFINLRNVKYGDIWRYNSTSDEMRRFLENPSPQTMRTALAAHRELIKRHKKANDEFYLGARTLMRLISQGDVSFSSFVGLMLILNIFVPNFKRTFISPHLWVSHIPELEGLEASGRAGVRLSFLDPGSIGGHYMIFRKHVMICLLSSTKGHADIDQETKFAQALRSSLDYVKVLAAGYTAV